MSMSCKLQAITKGLAATFLGILLSSSCVIELPTGSIFVDDENDQVSVLFPGLSIIVDGEDVLINLVGVRLEVGD